jgi:hypothetical protein
LWRAHNPEYYHHRRLTQRSEAAEAAKEAAAAVASGKVPERDVCRPAVTAMPAAMARVPWDLVQDELGVQVTDVIGVTAREILRAVQDQMGRYLSEDNRALRPLQVLAMKDQMGARPP